jgi:hypothetical protein
MRARPGRPVVVLALLAAGLAAAAALGSLGSADPGAVTRPVPLDVAVFPVPLDPADASRDTVGALRFLGGLWLRSEDPRFGGLSDLRVSPDGSRLLAVTDCGSGIVASLRHDASGRLVGLSGAELTPLAGRGGRPLALGESDAESLVVGEGLEVGFEGKARVESYSLAPPFHGPPQPQALPGGVAECGRNGGIEAMADMGGGRRFLACEARRAPSLSVPAWVGADGAWTPREYPLVFEGGWGGEAFRPVGAALLPGGDLLVAERRFPPLGTRIVRLSRESLERTGRLAPRELARLESPLTADNFEGIDVRRDAAGRTIVYLLSDDNDCAKTPGAAKRGLQRTLLLQFALEDGAG